VTSPATVGHHIRDRLLQVGQYIVYDGNLPGDPVLNDVERRALQERTTEAEVVAFLTPVLAELLASAAPTSYATDLFDLVLVNSENHRWLDERNFAGNESSLQKPDLYVTWRPFVRFKGSTDVGSECGALAHRALQLDGVVLIVMDAKLGSLTDAARGQVEGYIQRLPDHVRGLLFNKAEFQMFTAAHGASSRIELCRWDQSGTKRKLCEHFSGIRSLLPPLVDLLHQLLSRLSLQLDLQLLPPEAWRASFLGAGSRGRVFAVKKRSSPDGHLLALKVVVTSDDAETTRQFEVQESAGSVMMTVSRNGGVAEVPAAVQVIPGSLTRVEDLGVGYLMASVGRPMSMTKKRIKGALLALAALHRENIVHGDARVPNVLEVDGSMRWTDFHRGHMFSAAHLPHQACADVETFCASVLLVQPKALSAEIAAAVRRYLVDVGNDAIMLDVLELLWGAREGSTGTGAASASSATGNEDGLEEY
jgi:hypothetical protein